VIVDGRLDDEVALQYFQATPFTGWTLSLPALANPMVDPRKIQRIVIELSGSAIGDPS
jgi:hypothetical protein